MNHKEELNKEDIKKVLRNRLVQLRNQRNWTQEDVAIRIDIPRGTYSGYEKGIREAGYDILVKLSDLFDVTIDYLLGIDDKPNYNTFNAEEVLKPNVFTWHGKAIDDSVIDSIRNLLQHVAANRIEDKEYS